MKSLLYKYNVRQSALPYMCSVVSNSSCQKGKGVWRCGEACGHRAAVKVTNLILHLGQRYV